MLVMQQMDQQQQHQEPQQQSESEMSEMLSTLRGRRGSISSLEKRSRSMMVSEEEEENHKKKSVLMVEEEVHVSVTDISMELELDADVDIDGASYPEDFNLTKDELLQDAKMEQQPEQVFNHAIYWSVAAEKGYKNIIHPNTDQLVRQPIHPDLEDIHWPSTSAEDISEWESGVFAAAAAAQNSSTFNTTTTGPNQNNQDLQNIFQHGNQNTNPNRIQETLELPQSKIFILADGHGGVEAARFFVPRCKNLMYSLMTCQTPTWDFSLEHDQSLFEEKASMGFMVIDAEYCAWQVERYRRWVDSGSRIEERPMDDGCTLVVTVVHKGYMVNLNVGDSRSVVFSRPCTKKGENGTDEMMMAESEMDSLNGEDGHQTAGVGGGDWVPVFSSVDHNMTHPQKVWDIHRNGGHFLNPNGSLKYVHVEHPSMRQHRPYVELNGGRIYRHPSEAVRTVGVSHRRTLNLTATMGDLLFKIVPAVLSPVPDIRFMKMDSRRDYIVVMATDGVWDHLSRQWGGAEDQNVSVMEVVVRCVERWERDCEEVMRMERMMMMKEMDVESGAGPSSSSLSVVTGGAEGEVDEVTRSASSTPDSTTSSDTSNSSDSTAVAPNPPHPNTATAGANSSSSLSSGSSDFMKHLPSITDRLSQLARCFITRERLGYDLEDVEEEMLRDVQGLFLQRQGRYDDATAFVMYMKGDGSSR
jgi:serine/threonine protein phosphatase PrpC